MMQSDGVMLTTYTISRLEAVGRKYRNFLRGSDLFWLRDAADDVKGVLEDLGIDVGKAMLCSAVWLAFDRGLHSEPCRRYDPLLVEETAYGDVADPKECTVCGFGEDQHVQKGEGQH